MPIAVTAKPATAQRPNAIAESCQMLRQPTPTDVAHRFDGGGAAHLETNRARRIGPAGADAHLLFNRGIEEVPQLGVELALDAGPAQEPPSVAATAEAPASELPRGRLQDPGNRRRLQLPVARFALQVGATPVSGCNTSPPVFSVTHHSPASGRRARGGAAPGTATPR